MDGQRLAKTRKEKYFLSQAAQGREAEVKKIIERAKQTNTNVDGAGRVKELLGLRNAEGNTALHLAAKAGHHEVVKMLVAECPELLRSVKNDEGKYDETIIQVLKTTTDAPAAVISIDQQHQEPIVYTESKMDQAWNLLQDVKMSLDNHGEIILSPNKNTILHISSMIGHAKYVEDILKKHPSLLCKRNLQGETPAYIAASKGHMDIVEMIIMSYLKTKKYEDSTVGAEADMKELMTRSTDKDTALLVAIRNHYAGVVFSLMKLVPVLAYCVNNSEVSPLYLAAEKGYGAIVKHILETCEEASFQGPHGKTALHASALSGSSACMEHLLARSKLDLHNAQDANGWTPLYYAAYFDQREVTKALVTKDRSTGYHLNDKDDINGTAIHIAASRGHYPIIEIIMNACYGCWEITNRKGRNILHIAVEKQKKEVIDFILGNESLASLINQKDNDGNTPLHLLVASDFEMEGSLIKDTRVDIYALNNEKRTPLDIASSVDRRHKLLQATVVGTRKEKSCPHGPEIPDEEKFEALNKIMEKVIIVATLVATATYAAAFAVPGGYDGRQGMPILLKKPFFRTFFRLNAFAFISSCIAIFLYIMSLVYHAVGRKVERTAAYVVPTYVLVGIALVAMLIAFIIGLSVVFEPSHPLAISLCAISLFLYFILFHIKQLRHLYSARLKGL